MKKVRNGESLVYYVQVNVAKHVRRVYMYERTSHYIVIILSKNCNRFNFLYVSKVSVSVLLRRQSRLSGHAILKWFSNESRQTGHICQLTSHSVLRHIGRKKQL